MKAAIIGAGFAADVHAAALRTCGIDIAAVVCLDKGDAEAFAGKWHIESRGDDIAIALKKEIDAVHICTPPTTHGALIRQCIRAGKHVVCEKPLCVDSREAEALAKLAEQSNRICAVMLNVRYHMACQRAREIMVSGELGRPLLIHGRYMQEFSALPAPFDWRYKPEIAGKMRTVTELGTHWMNIAEFLSGQEITAVSAQFGRFYPERLLKNGYTCQKDSQEEGMIVTVDSEDAAIVNLKYSNGAIGSVVLSGVSHGRGNYLDIEITCEKGSLWWNEEENNVLHIAAKGNGIRRETFAFGNGFADTFAELLKRFYQSVQNGEPSGDYPGFYEGERVCRICDAVYESAVNNSKWINT